MWEQEITPENIGRSVITFLHKKGATSSFKNYRTLSVGCNLCKVYLKFLENRLRLMTERCGLLGECQNGFRKGRRCQDNLLIMDTLIALAKSSGKEMYVAMLDITKAYDRVCRETLWAKFRMMNMPEKYVRIFTECYKKPMGFVRFQGMETDWIGMPIGLKQGCVLSPLLFALFLADLLLNVQALGHGPQLGPTTDEEGNERDLAVSVALIGFADDLLGCGTLDQVQITLGMIGDYAAKNGLEFSPEKSVIIPFRRTYNKKKQKHVWTMGSLREKDGTDTPIILKEVDESKYLGVIARWNHPIYASQMDALTQKACSLLWCTLASVRGTTHPVWFGGSIWNIYARPAILYSLDIIEMSESSLIVLETIQRRLMRSLLRLPWFVNSMVLYAETGIRPLRYDMMQAMLNYWCRTMQLSSKNLAKKKPC